MFTAPALHNFLLFKFSRIIQRSLLLLINLSLLTCTLVAQDQKEMPALEQGKPIERELAGDAAHSYSITLAANQFLYVVVEQKGIDVVVTLFAQDGKKLVEVDSPNGSVPSGARTESRPYESVVGAPLRGRPLIVDHEIISLPSASTLAVLRREVAGRKPAPKTVVALADPVFMKTDERVKGTSSDNVKDGKEITNGRNQETVRELQLVEAAEDSGVANKKLNVPRLPGSRREAEEIVAMVPASESKLALDFEANRTVATSAELSQYRYIHFSTHGFLNSVHPELSGIVFSLVNERGEAQDGFLRAHEVFNLKLPAELVVLSACQTGIGKEVKGEGLVSLTRGFMYAGAPRVVVSLWSVSENGTQS